MLFALAAGTQALAGGTNTLFQAITNLNPIGYWPLNETVQPPPGHVATNIGTLGAQANGCYNDPYFGTANGSGASGLYESQFDLGFSLFTGGVPGVTSDGDTAAFFNGGTNAGNPSVYLVIPHRSQASTIGVPFSTEIWVYPTGGDPNDPSGTSYASTEWAGIIKQGAGGAFYTDADHPNGNTAGWCISLAGAWTLGFPVGWYTGNYPVGPTQLQTNACWVVDFFNDNQGNSPSMEFDVPFQEPTPQWFHLVLTYDGTNANFYTNGVLAATTVPGSLQSTNPVFGPGGSSPVPFSTEPYAFTLNNNGQGYVPDAVNPIVLGNLNDSYAFVGQGYPAANAIGFNSQVFQGAMDEVAIYTNLLSAATVLQHYTDAKSADHTKYTNDVMSLNPPVYLRLDEPNYTNEAPVASLPVAANYGTASGITSNALYQPGVLAGVSGPAEGGFGPTSYASAFNGLDAGVDVSCGATAGGPLDPQGNSPLSIVAWFKAYPTDSYAWFQTILGRGDLGWRIDMDTAGAVHFNPGSGPELVTPNNLNDGGWHMVAGVSDGTTAYLYIDGQLSATNTPVGAFLGSAEDLLIGGAPDYTAFATTFGVPNSGYMERYFAGEIAQVAFFGTALTASQINGLFDAAAASPFISQQPASQTVSLEGSASFSVAAVGIPNLGYLWYSGTPASGTPVSAANASGTTTSTLTFTGAQTGNSGSYFVVITNAYGAATSSVVTLTVALAPVIVTNPQPTTATVYAGNQVDYSVVAAGPSLSYQWYAGSTAVPGATTAAFDATASAGTTAFKCVVTNVHGSVTSSVVTLTGQAFVPPAGGFVINYNDRGISAYQGLGAYNDAPSHTNWNLFPFNPNINTTTGFAIDSADAPTLVTLSMDYGFDNGALPTGGSTTTPCFLVCYEAGINAANPGAGTSTSPLGTFTFNDVPQGYYTLYVYSANYDGNRGSIITLAPVNGGYADQGINATTNVQSDHTCDNLVEGDNYVFFHNVAPDPTGAIYGSFVPNPAGQLQGEGQVDALQLVLNTLSIQASGTSVIITWTSGGTLQSAPSPRGPWTTQMGTSPLTLPATGSAMFFRVLN